MTIGIAVLHVVNCLTARGDWPRLLISPWADNTGGPTRGDFAPFCHAARDALCLLSGVRESWQRFLRVFRYNLAEVLVMTIPDSDADKPHAMYFQQRYITTDFDFGDTQIIISNSTRKMDFLLRKRIPEDGPLPALEKGDGFVSITCKREMTERIYREGVSSGCGFLIISLSSCLLAALAAPFSSAGLLKLFFQGIVIYGMEKCRWNLTGWPLLMSMRKPSADGHDSTGFRVSFDFTSVHRHYFVKA
jgi:hypothetical protein